ncbi:MAG: hypothetical protein ABEJ94_06345 [Halorientalis sp.]
MQNPRALGVPPLVLGLLMLQSSASGLLEMSYALDGAAWLLNIPGVIFGLLATLVGLALVLNLGEHLPNRSGSRRESDRQSDDSRRA